MNTEDLKESFKLILQPYINSGTNELDEAADKCVVYMNIVFMQILGMRIAKKP